MEKRKLFLFQSMIDLSLSIALISIAEASVDDKGNLRVDKGAYFSLSGSTYRTITINDGGIALNDSTIDQSLIIDDDEKPRPTADETTRSPEARTGYEVYRNSLFNSFATFQKTTFLDTLSLEGNSAATLFRECSLEAVHLYSTATITINNRKLLRFERSYLEYCGLLNQSRVNFAGDGNVWNVPNLAKPTNLVILAPTTAHLSWIVESPAGDHNHSMVPFVHYTSIRSLEGGRLTGVVSLVQSYGEDKDTPISDFSKLLARYAMDKTQNYYGIPLASFTDGSTALVDFKLELLTDFVEDPETKQLSYQTHTALAFDQEVVDSLGDSYQFGWVKSPTASDYFLTVTDTTPKGIM